jgi:dCTP deaminase
MLFPVNEIYGMGEQAQLPIYQDQVSDLRNISMRLAQLHGAKPHVVPEIHMFNDVELGHFAQGFQPMITPFSPQQIKSRVVDDPQSGRFATMTEKVISSGLSSYGYDVTCGDEFKIFTNVNSAIVDPKNFDPNSFVDVKTTAAKPYILIPPNSFALAVTEQYFRIPRDVLTVCLGKSTYARCGIIVNVTPFEPEWEGYVTLEFSNTTPLPAKVYAHEGCAQVLFFRGSEPCEVSYKDRKGKYQGQVGSPVTPKV